MKKISNERLRDWINAYDEIGDNDLALVLRELLDLRERYDRANLDIAHKICELGVEKEYTGRLEDIEHANIQSVDIEYIRKDIYDDLLRRVKEVALEIEGMPIHQLDFKQIAVNLYGDKREKSMKNKILATLHDHIQELED